MSNQVSITIMETKVVGQTDVAYGVLFSDDYGTEFEEYDSLEQLKEVYPTKQSLVDHLGTFDSFTGSDYILYSDDVEPEIGQFAVTVYGYE